MKKICIVILLMLGIPHLCFSGNDKGEDILNSLVFKRWLTEDTVNFGNLKYTGTYPVFYFWAQCTQG